MANLIESSQWVEGIYQIEEDDPVMGGADGVDNRPHKELAARTKFLKGEVDTLKDQINSMDTVEGHNGSLDAHGGILHLRKPNTVYAVGDIAYSPDLPSWACLECVTAGETANTNIKIPQNVNGGGANKVGFTVIDGTLIWLFRHKDDTKLIGEVYSYSGVMSADGLHPIHKILGIPIMNHWICNGANGTYDLRDRFIVGAGNAYKSGDTGGANTVALTAAQMPIHTHGASAWTDAQGLHAHTLTAFINMQLTQGSPDYPTAVSHYGTQLAPETSWNGSHAHNVGVSIANAGGNAAHENRPPYYALTYIIKL